MQIYTTASLLKSRQDDICIRSTWSDIHTPDFLCVSEWDEYNEIVVYDILQKIMLIKRDREGLYEN